MKTLVSRFVKDESGATAIEYGLIAAGISVAEPYRDQAMLARSMSPSAGIRAVYAEKFHNMSHVFSLWACHLRLFLRA